MRAASTRRRRCGVYLYIFRNRATFERLRATVDDCARTYVTDPETFESIEESPYVIVGAGAVGHRSSRRRCGPR